MQSKVPHILDVYVNGDIRNVCTRVEVESQYGSRDWQFLCGVFHGFLQSIQEMPQYFLELGTADFCYICCLSSLMNHPDIGRCTFRYLDRF